MSRTDAHVPYRVFVGESHRSNEPPIYHGTPEYLVWRQRQDTWNWHELNKHWSSREREGSWTLAGRRRRNRAERHGVARTVRDEYAAMLDDQDADLMDCYDY